MPRILLDTNTYTLFKRNSEEARLILEAADEVGLPSVVIAELYAGFYGGTHFVKNDSELQAFLQEPQVRRIELSLKTPEMYGEQFALLKKQGISVPHNDLWIAAMAIEHNFVVYSFDKHLQMIPTITVIKSFSEFLDLT